MNRLARVAALEARQVRRAVVIVWPVGARGGWSAPAKAEGAVVLRLPALPTPSTGRRAALLLGGQA